MSREVKLSHDAFLIYSASPVCHFLLWLKQHASMKFCFLLGKTFETIAILEDAAKTVAMLQTADKDTAVRKTSL